MNVAEDGLEATSLGCRPVGAGIYNATEVSLTKSGFSRLRGKINVVWQAIQSRGLLLLVAR